LLKVSLKWLFCVFFLFHLEHGAKSKLERLGRGWEVKFDSVPRQRGPSDRTGRPAVLTQLGLGSDPSSSLQRAMLKKP